MQNLIETLNSLSFNEDEFVCNHEKENSITYVVPLSPSSEDIFEVKGLAYYFFNIIISSSKTKEKEIEKLHKVILEKYGIPEEKLLSDIDSFLKTAMEQKILVL
ncbi:MAG: hypothetical protein CME64_01445 [Halobacteriovoraceae bacterium]|nr:hypothetical protein [Halobacteriovoraceae bacterium]|tara:strand:- start:7466 stop:7777 length:312 start_codon:yes stop_codon:yes gene_type:complete